MATYTQRFESEDDYEAWLASAGHRINVVTIQASEVKGSNRSVYTPRRVQVRYTTNDSSLAPRRAHTPLAQQSWKLAPVFTLGALLALLAAYAVS